MSSIEAVIYDYDGLMVNTEDLWFRGCQTVCVPYGVEITEAHRLELMRSKLTDYLVERFELPVDVEALRSVLYEFVNDKLAAGIPLMPGCVESVELYAAHFPLAVGTGSRHKQVTDGLKQLELLNYFKVVVGGDMVPNGKPAPDIYSRVASELDVNPANCVVFEDQPKGVTSAKTAGMKCVAVPNALLPGVDFSHADIVIPHLGLATMDLIAQLEAA